MTVNQNDVIRTANIMGGLGADEYVNVWFTRYESPAALPDQTIADDIALFLDSFYNGLAPLLNVALTFARTVNKNITQDVLMPDSVFPTTAGGSGVGQMVSPQVAGLLIGRTVKSRVQRRMYLPGLEESNVTNGNLSAATITALLTAGAQMMGAQTVNGSLYRTVVRNLLLGTDEPISSVFVVGSTRTQRRRTIGRGS